MLATLRNHPLLVASTAASLGVLLGAYVAAQVLVVPGRPDSTTVQAAAETKVPPPRAETTGSAPRSEGAAVPDCASQTWPYLSRDCVEQAPKRSLRVVAPDNIDRPTIGAIEASKPPAPAATAPVPDTATPIKATPAPVTTAALPAEPAPPAAEPVTSRQPAAKARHERKKAKRKPRKQDPETAPDNDREVAGDGDEPTARPADRRRIADRWTERDYDVPAYDGRGRRRVTVIHRRDGPFEGPAFGDRGPFGGLFGFR
jgi:hypothetical protein